MNNDLSIKSDEREEKAKSIGMPFTYSELKENYSSVKTINKNLRRVILLKDIEIWNLELKIQHERENYKEKLNQATEKFQTLGNQIKSVHDEKKDLEGKNITLTNDNKALKEKFKLFQKERTQKDEKLKLQIEQLEKNIHSLNQEKKEQYKTVNTLNQILKKSEKSITNLTTQIEKIKQDLSREFAEVYENTVNEKKKLERMIFKLNREKEQQETTIHEYMQKSSSNIINLTNQLKISKKQWDELLADYQRQKEHKSEYKSQLKEMTDLYVEEKSYKDKILLEQQKLKKILNNFNNFIKKKEDQLEKKIYYQIFEKLIENLDQMPSLSVNIDYLSSQIKYTHNVIYSCIKEMKKNHVISFAQSSTLDIYQKGIRFRLD